MKTIVRVEITIVGDKMIIILGDEKMIITRLGSSVSYFNKT